MTIHDLATPALLLDLDVFERNVETMSERARRSGKRFRPHAKAHKCVEIAKRQIATGAVGVCVATVPEAEMMVRAGIRGILLTSPIADPNKCSRMAALCSIAPDTAIVVDHSMQAAMYSDAAASAGVTLNVLVDLDVGDHRTGAAPGTVALDLARLISCTPHLRFAGLQAYSVRASHLHAKDGRAEYSARAIHPAAETRDLLASNGIGVDLITGGSTGTYLCDSDSPVLTELQAGSYALMDVAYHRVGGIEFGHALSVLATVISANHSDRVTVDAGFKAFSTDRPFGPDPFDISGARYEWAGDEFGYVFLENPSRPILLGDRLRFIPPHCDPTVNLYDCIHVCRGDKVEDVWSIMNRPTSTTAPRPTPSTEPRPLGSGPHRISSLKPTAVNSILAEVRALQAQGGTLVSLMRGEPDFPTPDHIVEAAMRSLRSGRTSYADNRGEATLRQAAAQKLTDRNAVQYDPASEILVTDGATLGVYAALMALVGSGDEVLLPDPIYDAYQSPIRLAGASPRPVKSSFDAGRFQIDVDALEAACTPATRVLLLNTPWNPVGTVFTRAELTEIANFVLRRGITLISDEIYESITYDGYRHISPASLSDELKQRCVIINSLSKTYSMTGWRLGYCAGPADIIRSMLLVLQQSSRGPATFIQDAGVAALSGPQDCVEQMRREYEDRRRMVSDALTGLPRVNVLPPEGGFFAMVDVRECGLLSDDVRKRLLNENGVVVAHGSAYGEGGEGTLRVSFASGGTNLSRGLDLLREGLSAL